MTPLLPSRQAQHERANLGTLTEEAGPNQRDPGRVLGRGLVFRVWREREGERTELARVSEI